jgi:hypothetical protein
MSIRKQSPYGPFVRRVMLPAFRIGLLLAALLAIGFGSWLETNDSFESCSFKNSMSFHQVYLYRNISSNLTTPDSVSFGLWKSCYFYALNCSCTLTNLYYEPGKKKSLFGFACKYTEHDIILFIIQILAISFGLQLKTMQNHPLQLQLPIQD